MKKYLYPTIMIVLVATAFFAGYLFRQGTFPGREAVVARKVLYYVDPMNPGHRYDKPGIAPCGMQLEPVYADGGAAAPAGSVRISPEKQQLIGVKVEEVEKASATHTIRLLGRVAADETRVYRINAFVDGWIRKAYPHTTGSLVGKGELLATFYSPAFLAAEQSYIYSLPAQSRFHLSGHEEKPQQTLTGLSLRQYEDNLRNLGMGDRQIEELARTRQFTEDVQIRSPVAGFIFVRNITPGLKFEKGSELFRIADLSRVWILLDTYENESRYFKAGQKVPVNYGGKTYQARVSAVPPEFDASTRTLKVRLEVDNPGFILRPDMFVDVDFPVRMPPAVTVPVDAVLDSGLKKVVFVDRGNGLFEPRKVETGRYFEDRVEIAKGLMPGERIVVSGNFLIDSESRMKAASSKMSGTGSIDPVCGMLVDQGRARGSGLISEFKGDTFYFCTKECKVRFDKSPDNIVKREP